MALIRRYPFRNFWKRIAAACFDAAGAAVTLPFRVRRRPLDPGSVRQILVVRLDHIGDAVMTRPAVRALRKKFPHAAIDLLADGEIAPLFENAKELRAVIPVRDGWFSRTAAWRQKLAAFRALIGALKEKHYDLGFDFRGDLRNILLLWFAGVSYRVGFGRTGGGFLLHEDVQYDAAQHQVLLGLSLLRSFHVAQDNKLLPFEYAQEREREFWDTTGQLLPTTDLPRVVIHAEAGYPSKCWPLEDFRALIHMIDREALAQVVLIGTEGERERGPDLQLSSERFVDLRGKTALRDLPVLFDACDVFIGNDSGPAHIAAAQGLEIVLLASGTNDMRFWYPWTDRLILLHCEVPCAPCGLEVCPVEGHPCMESVTVDQAFDALRSVLARLQKRS